jgi:hypothetical protein
VKGVMFLYFIFSQRRILFNIFFTGTNCFSSPGSHSLQLFFLFSRGDSMKAGGGKRRNFYRGSLRLNAANRTGPNQLDGASYFSVGPSQETSVKGVFACGDNTTAMRTVANAVAMGTATGIAVSKQIILGDF